jgi:hypothetical protein
VSELVGRGDKCRVAGLTVLCGLGVPKDRGLEHRFYSISTAVVPASLMSPVKAD